MMSLHHKRKSGVSGRHSFENFARRFETFHEIRAALREKATNAQAKKSPRLVGAGQPKS
jgi:hypothetical protein